MSLTLQLPEFVFLSNQKQSSTCPFSSVHGDVESQHLLHQLQELDDYGEPSIATSVMYIESGKPGDPVLTITLRIVEQPEVKGVKVTALQRTSSSAVWKGRRTSSAVKVAWQLTSG